MTADRRHRDGRRVGARSVQAGDAEEAERAGDAYVVVGDQEIRLASIPKDCRENRIMQLRRRGQPVTEQRIAEMWAMDKDAWRQSIPAADRKAIIAARQRAGLPVTEQAIAEMWVQAQKKKATDW